jgi:hypothetical protein
MAAIKDGGPAFPRPKYWPNDGNPDGDCLPQGGMSLRDYFAAQALAGSLASDAHPDVVLDTLMDSPRKVAMRAEFAYALADAMLKAREGK